MDLYLSEFAVLQGTQRHSSYAEATSAVLAFCAENSVHCWRSAEFADYAEIERRIKISGVFVALIDEYWTSSTWKAHEFTYSAGGPSMNNAVNGKQTPVRITFLAGSTELPAVLRSCPDPTVTVRTIPKLKDALALTRKA